MTIASMKHTIASDVANNGTFTVNYPAGTNSGTFATSNGRHKMFALAAEYSVGNGGITVAFGASTITVTWKGGMTLPAGTFVSLEFQVAGPDGVQVLPARVPSHVIPLNPVEVSFGAVPTLDDDGLFAATTLGAAGNFTLNGALCSGGVGTFPVASAIAFTVATTDQSAVTLTITGADQFGNPQTETVAGPNANTVYSTKAYKTVTNIAASAAVNTNGIKAGTSNKLALPFFTRNKGDLLLALVDGVDERANTTVTAGVTAQPTAATGDPCGLIAFNTAFNGTKIFSAIMTPPDVNDRGHMPYAA